MALVHALVPEPALPASFTRADLLRRLDLYPRLRGVQELGSCPWPLGGAPSSAIASHGTGVVAWDIVDEWGDQSFPASDPPANW
jgi:hypothetical protein